MIAQLRGTLAEKTLDRVVVDVGGVGYRVLVSMQTLAELPEVGRPVLLKTHFHVREDAQLLFGFTSDEERRAFELCTSVSGVGPKLALALLSAMRPEVLAEAVVAGDVARLQRTPGVGKKTAERLIVELRDRFDKLGLGRGTGLPTQPTAVGTTVVSALINLGYRPNEAERAVREVLERDHHVSLEVALKEALRALTG